MARQRCRDRRSTERARAHAPAHQRFENHAAQAAATGSTAAELAQNTSPTKHASPTLRAPTRTRPRHEKSTEQRWSDPHISISCHLAPHSVGPSLVAVAGRMPFQGAGRGVGHCRPLRPSVCPRSAPGAGRLSPGLDHDLIHLASSGLACPTLSSCRTQLARRNTSGLVVVGDHIQQGWKPLFFDNLSGARCHSSSGARTRCSDFRHSACDRPAGVRRR